MQTRDHKLIFESNLKMYVKGQFKRTSPKQVNKHFEKLQSMVRTYSAEKNLKLTFYQQKILHTCFRCFDPCSL